MIDNDLDTRIAGLRDDTENLEIETGMKRLSFVEVFALLSFTIMSCRVDNTVTSSYEFVLMFLYIEADTSVRRLLLHLRGNALGLHALAEHINIQMRFRICRAWSSLEDMTSSTL